MADIQIPANVKTAMAALSRNNMASYYVETAADVPAMVASLLNKGDTVAVGGSVTLDETGVMDLLRNGDYRFLDRYAEGLTREEITKVFQGKLFCGRVSLLVQRRDASRRAV